MSQSQFKIGIFDSGIGGLSIAKEVKRRLPNIPQVYWADTAYAPYGELSKAQLLERCELICQQFVDQGCQVIVVACNTATVNCIRHLRANFDIVFIGVEPGIKPAMSLAQNNIAVLATVRTIESQHYQSSKLNLQKSSTADVIDVKCRGLAESIERLHDELGEIAVSELLEKYLNPLPKQKADVLVLGCTHYNLVKPHIYQILERLEHELHIVDTAAAVTDQVERKVAQFSALLHANALNSDAEDVFYTSGALSPYILQLNYWLSSSAARQVINTDK